MIKFYKSKMSTSKCIYKSKLTNDPKCTLVQNRQEKNDYFTFRIFECGSQLSISASIAT